eukprot:TRINITY_DN15613_c0_g1_i4.p1 TRINITY_DN15613_c0_g1~~TRINITY_DN15613_c0_g1_i4.p1  ORF type:complete len:817 (+),score=103.16 TRINITY_DN15613_c0_g1_i4:1709-4159(+)
MAATPNVPAFHPFPRSGNMSPAPMVPVRPSGSPNGIAIVAPQIQQYSPKKLRPQSPPISPTRLRPNGMQLSPSKLRPQQLSPWSSPARNLQPVRSPLANSRQPQVLVQTVHSEGVPRATPTAQQTLLQQNETQQRARTSQVGYSSPALPRYRVVAPPRPSVVAATIEGVVKVDGGMATPIVARMDSAPSAAPPAGALSPPARTLSPPTPAPSLRTPAGQVPSQSEQPTLRRPVLTGIPPSSAIPLRTLNATVAPPRAQTAASETGAGGGSRSERRALQPAVRLTPREAVPYKQGSVLKLQPRVGRAAQVRPLLVTPSTTSKVGASVEVMAAQDEDTDNFAASICAEVEREPQSPHFGLTQQQANVAQGGACSIAGIPPATLARLVGRPLVVAPARRNSGCSVDVLASDASESSATTVPAREFLEAYAAGAAGVAVLAGGAGGSIALAPGAMAHELEPGRGSDLPGAGGGDEEEEAASRPRPASGSTLSAATTTCSTAESTTPENGPQEDALLVKKINSLPTQIHRGYHFTFGSETRPGVKGNYPGWKNQDTCVIVPLGPAPVSRAFLAVFDGHGPHGHYAAAIAREMCIKIAPLHIAPASVRFSDESAATALRGIFAAIDAELAQARDGDGRPMALWSGTTATAAIVDANTGRLASAHVGDSTLIVCNSHGAIEFKTNDHIVDGQAEWRVLAHGGEVRTATVGEITARRIFQPGSKMPGIMMARSLGDLVAHRLGVRSDPEVRTGIPFNPGSLLILSSDGIWEKTPPDLAALHCLNSGAAGDPQSAAQSLVNFTRARWSASNCDDITTVLVAYASS